MDFFFFNQHFLKLHLFFDVVSNTSIHHFQDMNIYRYLYNITLSQGLFIIDHD